MITKITGVLVLIGIIFSVYFYVDSWKADAKDLDKTNLTIQQMQQTYQMDKDIARYEWLDDEIFKLKEKYRDRQIPIEVRERIHKMQQEYQNIGRKLGSK